MMFKPTIENIISKYDMSNKILMPKNSGLQKILFPAFGFDLNSFEQISKEEYTNGKLIINLCRGEDVSSLVEQYFMTTGEKVIGITGDDLFDESKLRNPNSLVTLLETIDWNDKEAGYRRPALGLMKKQGIILEGDIRFAVNEKYKETSTLALNELKTRFGFNPIINVYSGGTEKTVKDGLNDACVEVIYTGKSIAKNNLELVEIIRFSDIAVIGVNTSSSDCFKKDFERILYRQSNPKEGSTTSKLLADPNKAMKKLGEETAEYMRAIALYENAIDKTAARDDIALEYQQLIYTAMLNAIRCGVDFKDITCKMYKAFRE